MVYILIGLIIFLIPFIIVAMWRKRPITALIVALIIMLFTTVAPGIIKTFQAMMIYGDSDPQLMAGGIAEALTSAILSLIIFMPLLVLFQWGVRTYYTKKEAKPVIDNP